MKLLEFLKEDLYKHYDLNNNEKVRNLFENEIKYLGFPILENVITLVLEIDNKIGWVCQLSKLDERTIETKESCKNNNEKEEIYSISFLTIHDDFKWRWYSKKILEHIFNMDLVKKSKFLECSRFTEEWILKLRKNILELWKKNNIDLYISKEWFFNNSKINKKIKLEKRSWLL